MAWDDEEDTTIYKVVYNHEEQYSIWPAYKELPKGWFEEGTEDLKQVCLTHIGKIWTDMRPKSLREHMDKLKAEGKI